MMISPYDRVENIVENYPLLQEGQFLTFLPSKWSKNGPFFYFSEIVYFFVISTQGIMGNKLRTLFHKISKNYPLLNCSQFLTFFAVKMIKKGPFLHFLEIVYFFVISTQGIMGNKLRTLFHKISKNYPLLNCSQFLTIFVVKMIKKGPFLHILEIVYFFVISTQGIMGNKLFYSVIRAGYQHFLLFPQCFQKASFPEASKGVIVWEWVKRIVKIK